jgi:hypothetical protein
MCEDVLGPILDQKEGKRSSHLSLLQYSFNLNIAIKKLISIEMTQITTEHELHFMMPSTDTRSNVLLSQSIQRKSDIVMKSDNEKNINKFKHGHDNDYAMDMEKSGVEISRSKSLSELTVSEVGIVLEALKLGKYKAALISNEIDGKCLMKCNTVEDAVNMGITIFVKASLLLDEIRKWKTSGVPIKYLSVDEAKSPIVSYVPITITHIIVLYITLQLSICAYTLIGCSIVNWRYFRSHVEW